MQIHLVRQFRQRVDPLEASLVAVENGDGRTAESLALLYAKGVVANWPDLMLVIRGGRVHFIEVKLAATLRHERTDLNAGQRELHLLLRFYDHLVSVVRNEAEFWAIVEQHGIEHKPLPSRAEQLLLPRPRRKPKPRPKPKPLAA